MVHIENIPHILRFGIVRVDSPNRNPEYVPIGDKEVIWKRQNRLLTSQQKVSDFIPFYFGPRTPMLYVIQHGYNGVKRVDAEKLVYCIVRLDDIINNHIDCMFTDGHVLNRLSEVYDGNRLKYVDNYIHYHDVYALSWDSEKDNDLKRRKEAELLLKNDLPVQYIKGFVVFNERAKQQLCAMGVAEKEVVIRADYYF